MCVCVRVPEDNLKCLSFFRSSYLLSVFEAKPLPYPQMCQAAQASWQATSEMCHPQLPISETTDVQQCICTSINPFPQLWDSPSAHGLSGTYLSRARERNLVYANVRSYCCTCCWPISRQNIDDSRWKASLRNTN